MEDHQILLNQLEEKIKSGRSKEVINHLLQITKTKLERSMRLPYAELARRAGAPDLAIQFLIHLSDPSPEEHLSYASSLRALGFLHEAHQILKKIDEHTHPTALLQKALLLFAQWKYAEAISPLEKFTVAKNITPYQQTIGQVNLLSAYISSEKHNKAENLGRELLAKTKANNYQLLYGNTLELLAQHHIFNGHFTSAKDLLEKAERVLKEFGGIYLLYVKKWKLILQLQTQSFDESFSNHFEELISISKENNHSEIIRDLEFFKAFADKDTSSLTRILTGTPMLSYRQRASKLLKSKIKIPQRLVVSSNSKVIFDPKNRSLLFKPYLRKFLWSLTRDFYKSISLGEIFSILYPEECFNPETSLKRIDNLSYRLNQIFTSQGLSIRIERQDYSYRLRGLDHFVVYQKNPSTLEIVFSLFKESKRQMFFQRIDLQASLNISEASAQRLINQALKKKKIKKIRSGPRTQYAFSNHRT